MHPVPYPIPLFTSIKENNNIELNLASASLDMPGSNCLLSSKDQKSPVGVPAPKGMITPHKSQDHPHPARADLRGHRTLTWQCHCWIRETQSLGDTQFTWMRHILSSPLPGPTLCLALGRGACPMLPTDLEGKGQH